MDNAFGVSGIESICDLDAERKQRFGLERTSGDAML